MLDRKPGADSAPTLLPLCSPPWPVCESRRENTNASRRRQLIVHCKLEAKLLTQRQHCCHRVVPHGLCAKADAILRNISTRHTQAVQPVCAVKCCMGMFVMVMFAVPKSAVDQSAVFKSAVPKSAVIPVSRAQVISAKAAQGSTAQNRCTHKGTAHLCIHFQLSLKIRSEDHQAGCLPASAPGCLA